MNRPKIIARVEGTGGYGLLNGVSIVDDRGLVVAVTIANVPELDSKELAAFIVRAVNSHQALVEALLQASAFILDLNPEAHVGRELVLGAIDATLASVEAKP